MSFKVLGTLLSIWTCVTASAMCPPVPPALTDLFKPGQIVLFGEIHGTREMPQQFASAVCHALETGVPIKVGLELPPDEESGVATWMRSPGTANDQARLLSNDFWRKDYQDGRASEAMFALSQALHRERARLDVFTFDRQVADRDRAMAERILTEVSDNSLTLVLTGNIHSRTRIGAPWDATFETMGSVIKAKDPNTVGVFLQHAGGTAWVCAPECGVLELAGGDMADVDTFARTEGPHGWQWRIGTIHASPPKVAR